MMEYKRSEQENEVVLTYCPTECVEAVELRYERELPERMRETSRAATEPAVWQNTGKKNEGGEHRHEQKSRTGKTVAAAVLCLALALGCVCGGLWFLVGDLDDFLESVFRDAVMPDGDSSVQQPDSSRGEYREESDRTEAETTIALYQPERDMAGAFQLAQISEEREVLSAGEIYRKLAPSTVTILGLSDDAYSVGTGIIFTEDGYIMTNYHVIDGCSGCEVWITNEYGVDASYDAKLVGGDEKQDIAILKVEAQELTPAEFGASSDLSVGDKVYAIGNPLGLELRSTFTDGIVSYVNRSVDVDGVTMTLIQTNAALNSGNSGGPLVNQYGQVVGINTIKMMSGYDTIEGLGFAIPTSIAARWINDILTLGEVRPQVVLGLQINRIPVTLPDGTLGLEVVEITKGLSAYRAGIQVGDYLVGFNGAAVSTVDEIYAQRQTLSVGDRVSVRIYRTGDYIDLTMVMKAE